MALTFAAALRPTARSGLPSFAITVKVGNRNICTSGMYALVCF
jgi:hypothetical protein